MDRSELLYMLMQEGKMFSSLSGERVLTGELSYLNILCTAQKTFYTENTNNFLSTTFNYCT